MTTGTQLLLHFDGANNATGIADASLNTFTLVNVGSAALSTASPKFGTAAGNFVSTGFDGWHAPITNGGPLDLHSTSFTVEMWVNSTASMIQGLLFSDFDFTHDYIRAYMQNFGVNHYATVQWDYSHTGGNTGNATVSAANLSDGSWHHVVISSDSVHCSVAVDGVWSFTLATMTNATAANPEAAFQIGYDGGSGIQGTGYLGQIDELRVSNLVVYPLGVNFTPPTAPFPNAILYTTPVLSGSAPAGLTDTLSWTPAYNIVTAPALLLHFDGTNGQTTTVDSSLNALPVSLNGGIALETAVVNFGTAALPANGSRTYASTPIVPGGPVDLSATDFTVEGWVYPTVAASSVFVDASNGGTKGFFLEYTAGLSVLAFVWNGAVLQPFTSGQTAPLNTWTHFALVRSGNTFNLYLGGVDSSSPTTISGSIVANVGVLSVGGSPSLPNFTGYIDEFRISSYAAYTANFTPPSVPFSSNGAPSTSYDLQRNGASIATVTGGATSYNDTVPAFGTYSYQVFSGAPGLDNSAGSNVVVLVFGSVLVPNVVGLPQAAGASTLISAGFQSTPIYQASSTVPAGIISAQNVAPGTYFPVGSNVTITVSTGPAMRGGTGGDTWGTNGGDQLPVGGPEILGHTLAQGAHPANALNAAPNQSVMAAMSAGQLVYQSTPDLSVPSTPKVG